MVLNFKGYLTRKALHTHRFKVAMALRMMNREETEEAIEAAKEVIEILEKHRDRIPG